MLRAPMLSVAALSLFAVTSQAQVNVERGLRLNADGAVRISNLVGTVHVTGWNRDSVSLHGSVPKGDKLYMGGGPQGMKLGVELMNDRNPQPSRLDVMVPSNAKLWVKTATADIEVSGVTGELDLYVVGGTIRVSGNPVELNAEAIDGDISIDGSPGWLRAKSASGSVSLKGSSPDLAVSTVSGAISINGARLERAKIESVIGPISFNGDVVKGASVDVDTHSGGVDFTIPRKSGADFDIASIAGAINNDLNFSRPTKGRYGRGSELVMTNSSGGGRVVVRSFKGTVTLHAAK